MGGAKKPFVEIGGRPVLAWTLDAFLEVPSVLEIVVALSADDAGAPPSWLVELGPRVQVVSGGATRTHSVWNGLRALSDRLDVGLVHDGARPLVRREWIEACIRIAAGGEGAVVGHPAVDTIKRVEATGIVTRTEDRGELWQVQTPQAFPLALLKKAYERALETGEGGTDDAQLVERVGGRIRLVRGSRDNLKITYPTDVVYAAAVLRGRADSSMPAWEPAP